jgi:hypothetical protein
VILLAAAAVTAFAVTGAGCGKYGPPVRASHAAAKKQRAEATSKASEAAKTAEPAAPKQSQEQTP